MYFGGSDGSVSVAKGGGGGGGGGKDKPRDPWDRPLPKPGKGVLDNPWS